MAVVPFYRDVSQLILSDEAAIRLLAIEANASANL
jgi:hypothetical protein